MHAEKYLALKISRILVLETILKALKLDHKKELENLNTKITSILVINKHLKEEIKDHEYLISDYSKEQQKWQDDSADFKQYENLPKLESLGDGDKLKRVMKIYPQLNENILVLLEKNFNT